MLITISRQYGAGGSEVARLVAGALGWHVVDNELVEQVAARAGLPPEDVAEREERVPTFIERLARTLAAATPELFPAAGSGGTGSPLEEEDLVRITETVVAEIADRGRVVLVGRSAPAVLASRSDALNAKVVAPKAYRIEAAAKRLGVPVAKAAEILEDTDRMRGRYNQEYYHRDWNDPVNYHIVLNTAALGIDGTVGVIVARARALGW
jgi:cytidylate kinase